MHRPRTAVRIAKIVNIMALTREELAALNNASFPDNNTGQILPEDHRAYNEEVLNYVDAKPTGGGSLTYLGLIDNEALDLPTMTANTFMRLTSTQARPVLFDRSTFRTGDKIVIIAPVGFEVLYFYSSGADGATTWQSVYQSGENDSEGNPPEGIYRYVATWFEDPSDDIAGGQLHVERYWETAQVI